MSMKPPLMFGRTILPPGASPGRLAVNLAQPLHHIALAQALPQLQQTLTAGAAAPPSMSFARVPRNPQ